MYRIQHFLTQQIDEIFLNVAQIKVFEHTVVNQACNSLNVL